MESKLEYINENSLFQLLCDLKLHLICYKLRHILRHLKIYNLRYTLYIMKIRIPSNIHHWYKEQKKIMEKTEVACQLTQSFPVHPTCFSSSNLSSWQQGWLTQQFDFYCIPARKKVYLIYVMQNNQTIK